MSVTGAIGGGLGFVHSEELAVASFALRGGLGCLGLRCRFRLRLGWLTCTGCSDAGAPADGVWASSPGVRAGSRDAVVSSMAVASSAGPAGAAGGRAAICSAVVYTTAVNSVSVSPTLLAARLIQRATDGLVQSYRTAR